MSTVSATALLLGLALRAGVGAGAGPNPGPDRLTAGPGDGHVVIRVYKRGVFSMFAHDHAFEPARFEVSATLPDGAPDRAKVLVRIDARSLEDHAHGLSEDDRKKVTAQARGPEVLDAERYPEIAWRCDAVGVAPDANGVLRGTAFGVLSLHGKERPVELTVEATPAGGGYALKARGKLRQTDFGMRPYSGVGGTVGVKDEVELEVELTLKPGGVSAR